MKKNLNLKMPPHWTWGFFIAFVFSSKMVAQIGINATNTPPAVNAMLDISSTSKGLLIPRMTTAQRNALTTSEGLTVYDTETKGFWFYNGTSWQNLITVSGSTPWLTSGNDIYNANTAYVGIGTNTPQYKLDILHPGSGGTRVKSIGGFSVLDIDAFSGDAALRFVNNGVNKWNLRNQPGTDNFQIFDLNGGGEKFSINTTTKAIRIAGQLTSGTNNDALSLGGFGSVSVDAPNIPGGRFRLMEDGNLGINDAAPQAKVSIGGNIKINDGSAATGKVLTAVDGSGLANWQNIASQWTTNGSNIFYNTGLVGIGQPNPFTPLNFASDLGNKISLYGNTSSHYGFGIQNALLQMYTDAPTSHIGFGHGSSGSFTERMRIINSGTDGMLLKGRIHLRNGTSPISQPDSPGIWLYRADDAGSLGFMGTQNNQNVGFYGGPRAWGFTYDAINSKVGIGNNSPNAPLSFGAYLEKKITLYPGGTGDVGFGVAGNQLQIYSDNPNAQVSIGYDAAGVFTDRFSVKANGALTINGNMGVANQVLTSNGANTPPEWKTPGTDYNNLFQLFQLANIEASPSSGTIDLPGMSQSISVTGNAKVIITFNINTQSLFCIACGHSRQSVSIYQDANYLMSFTETVPNDNWVTTSGTYIATIGPGTYNFNLKAHHILGPTVRYWGTNVYSNMTLQVVNQ